MSPYQYQGKVPANFYAYEGIFDWYRYPLIYPYSIVCIDIKTFGAITNDKNIENFETGSNGHPLTPNFSRFIFDDRFLIGDIAYGSNGIGGSPTSNCFFIFKFADSNSIKVNGLESLRRKLERIKFKGTTNFITIQQYAGLVFDR